MSIVRLGVCGSGGTAIDFVGARMASTPTGSMSVGGGSNSGENHLMSLGTILILLLILMLLGVIPTWPHSKSWGYGPSGGLGTVLIIVLILVLMGRI